jgi:NAD(P)-dependent dehydrogenase (short-subunit alcohol dehydrogenase family)
VPSAAADEQFMDHHFLTLVLPRSIMTKRLVGCVERSNVVRDEGSDSGNLEARTALVTGGGRGIGRAVAVVLAREGARVAVADIDEVAAKEVAQDLRQQYGVDALPIRVDCGDVAEIQRMVDTAKAELSRIDILVNNAATTFRSGLFDVSEAGWDTIHRLNAKGAFFCMQRVALEMVKDGGGRIVNIASIGGRGYHGVSNVAYAASEGAVIAMTHTAAQQLGPFNIYVNAICPGFTSIELSGAHAKTIANELDSPHGSLLSGVEQSIPIGRANSPLDVAEGVLFLVSDAARNITAQAYNIDGGLVPS